ncbi:glycosyltransferase [Paludibacter sp.]|uniref:glycosyltransferase n=1 Tax=Paludibacter sp. TaxID=1898105 RepID=UPI001354416F|nr:glycosyltransferase [Paludibacter sp.]MTK52586.1 glycosyltransferase [Paludibacter sp.]
MRIAYLLGSLNRGGTETLLLDCFRNAAIAGFPFIGIFRKAGILADDFKKTGVPLYCLSPKSIADVTYFVKLRKLLIRNKIAIVHAQQPLDALYARIATVGTGIKVALTFHGYDMEAEKTDKTLIHWIIRHTDLNIFVSNSQKKYYHHRYRFAEENAVTVYNGISFDKLTPAKSNSWRTELNITSDTILLGSVGNFGGVRDQLTICKFLKLLNDQGINFCFLFVGKKNPGEEWRYDQCVSFCHENGLDDKVLFLGARSDVPDILTQLDAFIYSTDHDTFGIAVIEAMASAIPVFVNDWEVMLEITDRGSYANIYNTKYPEDLLNKFLPFTVNPDRYKQKAEETARWVRETYSIESHLNRLKETYQTIINR